MGKLVLIASLLILVLIGCDAIRKPAYSVGDCYTDIPKKLERWQKDERFAHRVLEIGEKSYHTLTSRLKPNEIVFESTYSFRSAEYETEKIECPIHLQLESLNGK